VLRERMVSTDNYICWGCSQD